MDIAVYLNLLFTLFVSTIISVWQFKKKENKWLGILIGFCTNTVILTGSTIVFYHFLNFKGMDGLFAGLGILVFIFFVPIITCINFYVLEFVKNKSIVSNH